MSHHKQPHFQTEGFQLIGDPRRTIHHGPRVLVWACGLLPGVNILSNIFTYDQLKPQKD